jgi:hypothetical protein
MNSVVSSGSKLPVESSSLKTIFAAVAFSGRRYAVSCW